MGRISERPIERASLLGGKAASVAPSTLLWMSGCFVDVVDVLWIIGSPNDASSA